jgi:hypothetical protein
MSRLWDATVGTAVSKEPDIPTLMEKSNLKMKAANSDKTLKKGKGKVHPRTGHEGPEGEQMYSFNLP